MGEAHDMAKTGSEPEAGGKNGREEQLLHHASALFSHGGYRETSLQEIADKLGITRPLFYYYFKSKEDLLWRLIGHIGDELRDGARPIAESEAPPEEKLRSLLETHARTLLESSDTFRIYFAERHLVEGKRNRQLKRGEDEYFGLITQIIGDGQRSGVFRKENRRVLTHLAVDQINSLVRWFEPGGIMSAEDLAVLAADVAVRGLSATATAR
jgi:AcrR family transcriptional regulator